MDFIVRLLSVFILFILSDQIKNEWTYTFVFINTALNRF